MRAARTAPYNSALKGPLWPGREQLSEIGFAESARGMIFAHNICDPLPEPMAERIMRCADCVYCEIPWPASGETFYQRAGAEPAFLVGAKRDALALADDAVQLVSLNGRPAWLAISGAGVAGYGTTDELLTQLARVYRGVYDFGCGYGAALRLFAYFIGSDIDRKCLAYVQRELL